MHLIRWLTDSFGPLDSLGSLDSFDSLVPNSFPDKQGIVRRKLFECSRPIPLCAIGGLRPSLTQPAPAEGGGQIHMTQKSSRAQKSKKGHSEIRVMVKFNLSKVVLHHEVLQKTLRIAVL